MAENPIQFIWERYQRRPPPYKIYGRNRRCRPPPRGTVTAPSAHPWQHGHPREVHKVVCRVGRSGVEANARRRVLWSLILVVYRYGAVFYMYNMAEAFFGTSPI